MLAKARMPGRRTFLQFEEENARSMFSRNKRMTRQLLACKPVNQPVWEEYSNVEELGIFGGAWNSGVFPGLQFLNVDGPVP
jgi:hypothetical protein